jgi:hypothetical protein
MAEEAKNEVAAPAPEPEPAKDIAEEKALVVAEGTSAQAAPWLGAEELCSQMCYSNIFSCFPLSDAEKPAATDGSHGRGTVLVLFAQA